MANKEYLVDLVEMVKILKENIKPIVKCTCCAIVAGIVFLLITWYYFPTYESEAMLQIRQKSRGSGLSSLLVGMGGADFLSPDSSSMDSYIEILKSRSVIIPVIEATENKGFFGKYPDYRKYIEKRIKADIAKGQGVTLSATNILLVSAKAGSPEKAQRINQLIIDGFLKRVADLNSAEKGSVKVFLEKQLESATENLKNAEIALKKFKEENKILSPSSNSEIFTQRIMEVEKQAAANKVELEAAQARLAAINEQLRGSGSASANNQIVQQYQSELAKLETARISYQDKYTEKHPRMIEINEQIASLKTKIQEEVNKVASLQAPSDNAVHQKLVSGKFAAEGAITVAKQKGEALQQIIDYNNTELAKMPTLEQKYVRLSRDYSVANEIYMMLMKQLEQTKITENQEPTNVLVVDTPHLPDKPVFPRRGVTLMLAALLGLFASSVYVVFEGMKKRVIRSAETVTEYVGIPVLGSIPNNSSLTEPLNADSNNEGLLCKVRDFLWKK